MRGGVETEQRGNQSATAWAGRGRGTVDDGDGARYEGQKVLTGNIFEFLFNS